MREAVPPWEIPAAGTRAGGGRVTGRAHFGKPSETVGRKAMGTKSKPRPGAAEICSPGC